jgi:hypothetical protein
MSKQPVRMTMTASYRTAGGTATVILSHMATVDEDTFRDEMISVMRTVVRTNADQRGEPVVGEITVKRFDVEYL